MMMPINYDYDSKGNICLPDGAPFDGNPVLIKIAEGWCEAWWDRGRKIDTLEGTDTEGFCWVCLDDKFQADLDDAKYWMNLP